MLLSAVLSVLPLFVHAVPTASPESLRFQQHDTSISGSHGSQVPLAAAQEDNAAWGVELNMEELRLVSFGEDERPVWITEYDKMIAKGQGRRFMDITDTPTLGFSQFLLPSDSDLKYEYPSPGNHTDALKKIYKHFDLDRMKAFLTKFSGFRTRYYRSSTGKDSQGFLLSTLKDIAESHPSMTVSEFPHPWGQNSIIVHIPAESEDMASAPLTIVGCHQDSTNLIPFLPSPGADDDGSGTTSSLEALRALAATNFTPSSPVEFHYYSAEEGGLLGSQAIAKDYEDNGVKVLAMLQMDMTAWVKEGTEECVGVIEDFVDPALTDFLQNLVVEYLAIPPVRTQCGYACSDHSSFSKAGYQSAFAIESTFEDSNHQIHSIRDTIDHPEFSFKHMREFSKLAVAFAYELGNYGMK